MISRNRLWIPVAAGFLALAGCKENITREAMLGLPERLVECKGRVTTGNRGGIWYCYYPGSDGSVAEKRRYVAGRLNGVVTSYYPSGKILATIDYKRGRQNGFLRRYYEDESLKEEKPLRDDRIHGEWTKWHPGGKKARQGTYKKGILIGDEKFWDDKGKLIKVETGAGK